MVHVLLWVMFGMDVSRITDKNIKYNGDGTSSLWRRYSEFELLQNYLSITYPYVVVPPLPEKKVRTANLNPRLRKVLAKVWCYYAR